MILRANLVVPEPGAYVVAAKRIPKDWLAVTEPNLRSFVAAYPGWSYYMAGGIQSSLLGGCSVIREAEVEAWA